jgi:hypothetical protein
LSYSNMGLPTMIPPGIGRVAGVQARHGPGTIRTKLRAKLSPSVYDARMSSAEQPLPSDSGAKAPAPDDTAAFQAYYQGAAAQPDHGLLYRILVGWWRDRS